MGSDWKDSVRPAWKETDLDGELVFDRFLGSGSDLDVLQESLAAAVPRWCRTLRVWNGARDQIPVDVSEPGALAGAVLEASGERGGSYHAMVERYGRGPYERFSGSAELRGSGPELTVVVSLDEWVVSPVGVRKQLGNEITLQVRRAKVDRKPGWAWLRETMQDWCQRLSPAWASAHQSAEYEAKVMSDDPNQIRAVGLNFGRYLPGLFWWNFFGHPYIQLLGEQRLLSAPGKHVSVIGDGVLIRLSDGPGEWDLPSYVAIEQQIRDHLGPELFFSKIDPHRIGVVPNWGA